MSNIKLCIVSRDILLYLSPFVDLNCCYDIHRLLLFFVFLTHLFLSLSILNSSIEVISITNNKNSSSLEANGRHAYKNVENNIPIATKLWNSNQRRSCGPITIQFETTRKSTYSTLYFYKQVKNLFAERIYSERKWKRK